MKRTLKTKIDKVKTFLKNVKGTMEALVKNYIGRQIPIDLKIGKDGSYTDHKKITVSLDDNEAENYSMEDIARVVRFKVGHESQHIKSTVSDEYQKAILDISKKWVQTAASKGLIANIKKVIEIAKFICNGIEDGRIENIMVKDYPGLQKHRRWYRLNDWVNDEAHEDEAELPATINNLFVIATVGVMRNKFEDVYDKNSVPYKKTMEALPYVQDAIISATCKECMDNCKKVADVIEDLVLDALTLPVEELEKMIREFVEKNAGNDQNYGDGQNERKNSDDKIVSVTDEDDDDGNSDGNNNPTDLRKKPKQESKDKDDAQSQGQENNSDEKSSKSDKKNQKNDENSQNGEDGEDADSQNTSPEASNKDENGESGINDSLDENEADMSQSEGENNEASSEPEGNLAEGDATEDEDGENSDSKNGKSGDNSSDSQMDGGQSDMQQSNNQSKSENQSSNMNEETDNGDTNSDSESLDGEDTDSDTDGQPSEQKMDSNSKDETSEMDAQSAENTLGERKELAARDIAEKIKSSLKKAEDETKTDATTLVETSNAIELAETERKQASGDTSLSQDEIDKISSRFGGSDFVETKMCDGGYYSMISAPPAVKQRADMIRSKIENIINSLSTPDREEVYEGEVDANGLFKLCIGEYDVFREDGEPREADIACFLLKDNSGSMGGGKEDDCCNQLAILEESMKGLMKMKIASFSDDCAVHHYTIKDWDDEDDTNYTWSYHQAIYPGGGNHDAYSIMVATEELLKRSEAQKLLIVLSDGAPCCSSADVRAAVRYAREKGVFVISIFFGYGTFAEKNAQYYRDMYEKYYIGTTPDKIGFHLERLLEIFMETA